MSVATVTATIATAIRTTTTTSASLRDAYSFPGISFWV